MQKSILPFLASSFFAVFFLVSCGSSKVAQGFEERTVDRDVYHNPYFANPETDYVYKANISAYGNELTGVFIAKKINETTHRVVFTTEFGNKLLDFEISENSFKINSIVDELNRKMLINTLKTDFRLLLQSDFSVARQLENTDFSVYQQKDGNYTNSIFVTKNGQKLSKIVHSTQTKEKFSIQFTSENNIFADNIVIQHYTIPLKITLNYFKS